MNVKYDFLFKTLKYCIVGMCEVAPKSEGAKEFPVVTFWGHLFLDLDCVK